MPYTADPLNVNAPQDSDQARYAAAELRAIKGRLVIDKAAVDTLPAMVTATAAAQATANTANANAATAQATADSEVGATALAAAAQTAADGAQSTADTALALATSTGFTTAVLTGSGMWTVPSGVTEVIAFLQGGGSSDVKFTGIETSPIASIAFRQLGEVAATVVAKLSVTGGQELAYSVGVGQVIANPPAAFVSSLNLETQVPTPSYLAGYSAPAARPRLGMLYPADYPDGENTWGIAQSTRLDGRLGLITSPARTAFLLDTVSHNTAGAAGSITLLYR